MSDKPKISFYGDQAILLQWNFEIKPENLKVLLAAKTKIEAALVSYKIMVTNTYRELLVVFKERTQALVSAMELLKEIDFENLELHDQIFGRRWELPVCYDERLGLDIKYLAEAKELSVKELITLHTAPVYTVYFIGFLPGFPYLGGLDQRLAHPRRENPRKQIRKGAVGIAEGQTGIYPQESPAGWQIIGNCPIPLFDKFKESPALLRTGDEIVLKAVSLSEYDSWNSRVEQKNFSPENIMLNG